MLGERIDGVRVRWPHWFSGPKPSSLSRTCTGAVEHIARGWILIRRPRATAPALKRLAPGPVRSGRLSATLPDGTDILMRWLAEDDADRMVEALRRHVAP